MFSLLLSLSQTLLCPYSCWFKVVSTALHQQNDQNFPFQAWIHCLLSKQGFGGVFYGLKTLKEERDGNGAMCLGWRWALKAEVLLSFPFLMLFDGCTYRHEIAVKPMPSFISISCQENIFTDIFFFPQRYRELTHAMEVLSWEEPKHIHASSQTFLS